MAITAIEIEEFCLIRNRGINSTAFVLLHYIVYIKICHYCVQLKCVWISFVFVINAVYLQVHTSSLVDIERDFLSVDKRYPRLFVSPEFSKVWISNLSAFDGKSVFDR